ncbi:U3 small nucleolar ribonucleoprotein protein IMP4 isoform X1 [Tympanuchus pallidicinctus]|uniref:U3 small nucleolar ribonucleoprotein protein IMP4 isoform X1 n=1 Tax=Tympanuchus pallidicinctus TaxID=109042 RepID=UPI002287359F|nr:U3 small nucleolar ribonucleoprotein protein IMP4 isoform X1 [Tympanuchus pallidicinctus]
MRAPRRRPLPSHRRRLVSTKRSDWSSPPEPINGDCVWRRRREESGAAAAMLRRQARERREYLQRRAQEERLRRQQDKKERLRQALDENRLLPTELRRQALALQKELEFETPGENGVTGSQDDEYRWAGLEPPKVMVTTSRDPSSRLRVFAKELCLVIPGARRLNRGRAEVGALVSACRAAGVTDLLVLHETRGQPDGLVLCHLPHGPTAHFTLSGAVLRHEVGGLGGAPLGAPHILLHRLDSVLGRRLGTILKHLFPVPRPQTRRVVTFANEDDVILVRNHVYRRQGKTVELEEVGPRFQLRPYLIRLGTLEQGDAADVEWRWHPYTATAPKRHLLSAT